MYFESMQIIAKYVFFERGLEGIPRKILHVSTVIAIILVALFVPIEGMIIVPSAIAMLLSMILQESTIRKRIRCLITAPIIGIMNGLFGVVLTIPKAVFNIMEIGKSAYEYEISSQSPNATLYAFGMSLVLLIVVISILYNLNFRAELIDAKLSNRLKTDIAFSSRNRSLGNIEKMLLYSVGTFELVISGLLLGPLTDTQEFNSRFLYKHGYYSGLLFKTEDTKNLIAALIVLFGVAILINTTIAIVVILIGNKRTEYRNEVQSNIIVMMAEIIENRDKDTGGHIQRTAKYVEIITNELRRSPYSSEITNQFINDIKVAAPLHDIGKIHVSDVILNKSGRLTPEEYEEMKSHAVEGRKLLTNARQAFGNFSYIDMAIEMATYHHEWWDGSAKGYPEHKAGLDIPLCARIMAVADVFDALSAKRIYKDPIPFNQSIKIIKKESGTHFDPIIVEAFFNGIDKIKAAYAEFESKD